MPAHAHKPHSRHGKWGPSLVSSRGFTLLELLMVVVIIGILAATIIPNFTGRSEQARVSAAKKDIVGSLGTALGLFEQDTGAYPTTQQGLAALITAPAGAKNWRGPYITNGVVPMDPWGNAYVYSYGTKTPGQYELYSAGPDGKAGTDDDITAAQTKRQ